MAYVNHLLLSVMCSYGRTYTLISASGRYQKEPNYKFKNRFH